MTKPRSGSARIYLAMEFVGKEMVLHQKFVALAEYDIGAAVKRLGDRMQQEYDAGNFKPPHRGQAKEEKATAKLKREKP